MRFLFVSIVAFLVDIVLALALREVFHLSVTLAAAISFIVIGIATYFVHEYFTFRSADSKASGGRLARNLVSSIAAFTTRVTVIAILEGIATPDSTFLAAAYIAAGAGASLAVNYTLNRFWVFSRK